MSACQRLKALPAVSDQQEVTAFLQRLARQLRGAADVVEKFERLGGKRLLRMRRSADRPDPDILPAAESMRAVMAELGRLPEDWRRRVRQIGTTFSIPEVTLRPADM